MNTDSSPSSSDVTESSDPPTTQPEQQPEELRWARFGNLRLEHKFWTNPRTVTGLADDELQDMATTIKAGTVTDETATYAGVRVALEVVKILDNGSVYDLVIDGQRRCRAMELAGLDQDDTLVRVIDLEPEPVTFTPALASKYLAHALRTVAHRAGLSSYELTENARRLRDMINPETSKEYTLVEIGATIGRHVSWVSRMLAAYKNAPPKLLHAWKIGEITDEVFKDTAVAKGDDETASRVIEASRTGDKAGARTIAKERAIQHRQEQAPDRAPKPGPVPKPKADPKPAASKGKEPEARKPASAPAPEAPVRKPPSFAVIEDFVGTAKRTPPTHDYVRGILAGAKWATGLQDPGSFSKPWHQYLAHVQSSSGKADKAADKAVKSKGKGKGGGKPKSKKR